MNFVRFAFALEWLKNPFAGFFNRTAFCFALCIYSKMWNLDDDEQNEEEDIGRLCNFGKIEFRSHNRNCHGKSKINGNRWFYLSSSTIYCKF